MWTKRRTLVSVLVSILSLSTVFAQSRTTRTLGTQRDDSLITLDFIQGTLSDYVRAVVEAMKGKPTIIIDSELEEVQVPPARLRDVTLQQALEWIPKTANARQQGLVLQAIARPGSLELNNAMFLFTSAPLTTRPGATADDLQVRTFALSWNTDASGPAGTKPELVKKVVEDALNKQGPTAKQPVQYNPQTGVLTVRGTPREINLAGQIMNEMRQAQQQATIIQQLQTELADLKEEVTELKQAGEKQLK
jgi:hypothetical protein